MRSPQGGIKLAPFYAPKLSKQPGIRGSVFFEKGPLLVTQLWMVCNHRDPCQLEKAMVQGVVVQVFRRKIKVLGEA